MTHEANGNAVLHIHVPEPNYLDFFGSPKAAGQIGMIKTMLAGARVLLAGGAERRAGSHEQPVRRRPARDAAGHRPRHRARRRDTAAEDPGGRGHARRSQSGRSSAPKGLKINLDPEITIEFTPAK